MYLFRVVASDGVALYGVVVKKNAPAFRPGLTNSLCQALLDRASPSSFLKKEIPARWRE